MSILGNIRKALKNSSLRNYWVDDTDDVILGRIPKEKSLSPKDKKYKELRTLKRSADLDAREGKQTVGPVNFKGDPNTDRRIAATERYNDQLKNFEDNVKNSEEVNNILDAINAYKNKEVKMQPLVKSNERYYNRASMLSNEQEELFNIRMKELEKQKEDIVNEMRSGKIDERETFRRLSRNYDAIDNLREEFHADRKASPDPNKIFYMRGTKENKALNDAINLDDDGISSTILDRIDREKEKLVSIPENNKPSNQKFITRYHTTRTKNLPSIFKEGLDPEYSGTGYGNELAEAVDDVDYDGVYTTAEAPWLDVKRGVGYTPDGLETTLELMIPKEEYRKLERIPFNVEGSIHELDKSLEAVQKGGRTDIFRGKIKPEWIVNAYDKKLRPQDFNDLKDPKRNIQVRKRLMEEKD